MKEFKVENFNDLHSLIDINERSTYYRGQASAQWELRPKAGRPPYNQGPDKGGFIFFKRNAVKYLPIVPNNEWDWLALAQHYGVPTRLLDWSRNPLIAAFFAVNRYD
jgi:hypothetical protein